MCIDDLCFAVGILAALDLGARRNKYFRELLMGIILDYLCPCNLNPSSFVSEVFLGCAQPQLRGPLWLPETKPWLIRLPRIELPIEKCCYAEWQTEVYGWLSWRPLLGR